MDASAQIYAVIGILFAAVYRGIPLLYGTMGEIITEKSGSLNLGVEGTMAVGAMGGYLCLVSSNSLFVGIIGAMLCAGLCGALFSFLTTTLKANQNVTGLAITIFGVGVCDFIGQTMTRAGKFPRMSEDLVSILRSNTGIPVLKDIPYIGNLLFSYNFLVYFGIALAIVAWVYIKYTRKGLKLRAISENPAAADGVGVNITAYKYIHVMLGSAIMGIGGLYMAAVINQGAWHGSSWINGYGWIAIALVIFASWSPAKAIWGAFLFGLLLALPDKFSVLVDTFPKAFSWVSSSSKEARTMIFNMLPYLITAFVLIISSVRKRKEGIQPAAIGLNYYREDR